MQWLGEVPAHWGVTRLKRCFTLYGGSTPKSDEATFWDGEIIWVSPADLGKLPSLYIDDSARKISLAGLNSCGTTLVPSGSIVLSTRAPIGSVAITKTELCTNQGCKSLVPKAGISPLFYAYHILASTEVLNILGRGTTFLELSADELGAFRIPLPPPDEQLAIASFLNHETSKIDALVAAQQKLIALLAEKRQALISHAVTRGLNPDVPMKDSGVPWLGDVPAHWEVKRQKFVTHLVTGKTEQRSNPVALENIESWSGKYVPTNSEFTGEGIAFECADILFGKLRPYLAKAYLANSTGEAVGDFYVLRPTAEVMPRFVQYQILTQEFITVVNSATFGSKMPRIDWGFLANMRLVVPPPSEQLAIASFLDHETSKIDALKTEAERAITLLRERRNALITAAVTGRIDVRNAAPE